MQNYFIGYLTSCIDSGKKITHERLTELLEAAVQDDRKREKIKAPKEVFVFLAICLLNLRSIGNL